MQARDISFLILLLLLALVSGDALAQQNVQQYPDVMEATASTLPCHRPTTLPGGMRMPSGSKAPTAEPWVCGSYCTIMPTSNRLPAA